MFSGYVCRMLAIFMTHACVCMYVGHDPLCITDEPLSWARPDECWVGPDEY